MLIVDRKSGTHVTALASLLAILSVAELLHLYLGWQLGSIIGSCAFISLGIILIKNFGLREWVLSLIAIALCITLSQSSEGLDTIIRAAKRAAFFAAFIYLVTLLKEAAQRSLSVLELGKFLTRQPPGRRFYSLAIGGHGMGVLLNFGAISLLTPLIQRGVRAETDDRTQIAIAEQRQISALVRGFSWMIMWSPTALTQAVLFTTFPNIDLKTVISLGIAASIIMVIIGRLEDLFRWRNHQIIKTLEPMNFPTRSGYRFLMICGSLISLTYCTVWIFDVSGAIALMLVAPFVMITWVFSQAQKLPTKQRIKDTFKTTYEILVGSATPLAKSAFTLGIAGFIGEAAATLVPIQFITETMGINALPDWLFLMLLPIVITLCGQIALSPILVVVFLGAVINSLPVLPADPNLIVFALGAGWALSMSASPNASATLLISAATNISPTTLTWRWNGLYALLCYLAFALSFIIMPWYF